MSPLAAVGVAAGVLVLAASVVASCGGNEGDPSTAGSAGGAGGAGRGGAGSGSGTAGSGGGGMSGASGGAGTSGASGLGPYVDWLTDDAAWTPVDLGVQGDMDARTYWGAKDQLGRAPPLSFAPCGSGCQYAPTSWTTSGATIALGYYQPGGAPLMQLQNAQRLNGLVHTVARWVDPDSGKTLAAFKLRYNDGGTAMAFMGGDNARFFGVMPSETSQLVAGMGKNFELAWANPHTPYTLHDWFTSDGEYPHAFVYNNGFVAMYRFPDKDPVMLDSGGGIETGAGWGDLAVWTKYGSGITKLMGYAEDGKGARVLLDKSPVPEKTVKLCVSPKWIWGIAGKEKGGFYTSMRAWRIPFGLGPFPGTPEVFELPWAEGAIGNMRCGDDWIVLPHEPLGAVGIRWGIFRPEMGKAWQLVEDLPTKVQLDGNFCATNDKTLWVSRGDPWATARVYKYDLAQIDAWASPFP